MCVWRGEGISARAVCHLSRLVEVLYRRLDVVRIPLVEPLAEVQARHVHGTRAVLLGDLKVLRRLRCNDDDEGAYKQSTRGIQIVDEAVRTMSQYG